jgi:dGTPase
MLESSTLVAHRLAAFTPEAAETSRNRTVCFSPALTEDRGRSMSMVGDLFQFFCQHPDRLPESYGEQARHEEIHRVVCGYIAGMTDAFFLRTFETTIGRPVILPRW